jgi:DNA-binding NtrC family response regulator
VILMTGHYSSDSAVEAIKMGAADYINKPLELDKLRARISGLVAEAQRRFTAAALDHELLNAYQFHGIIGRSPLMLEVFSRIQRIAPHFRTALILGATGTGKELVARSLHEESPVSQKKFATWNCSAVVESLFESELFGHVKGAFTGATQDKVGLFEYADGGTLFLDEIGEMPLNVQAKLLRVLQSQEIQRVGSPAVRKVNVRVVAATHRDLRSLVAEGKFREDLFYRISMAPISVPSLWERREDIPLLLRHFVEKFSAEYHKPIQGLTRRAQTVIARYNWPGNVRELENVIANACMMVAGDVIDVADLPGELKSTASAQNSSEYQVLTMDEIQHQHATRVLESLGGNKLKAAEMLGISRGSLYRILKG